MTLEEFKAEIAKDPTTVKTALAYVITLPEGKEVLDNFVNQQKPGLVKDAVADAIKAVEAKLATALGTAKPEGKAFEDYVEGIAKDLKKLQADAGKVGDEATKQKITELEGQLQSYKASNWEGKYKTLVEETAAKIGEYDTKLKDLEKGNLEGMVGTDLSTSYARLSFNPNIPKEAIEALASNVRNSVMKNAKVVDGKPVYYNEDGTPMLNELFKPITAEEIYRRNMATVLTAAGAAGGGATDGKKTTISKTTEGEKETKKLVLDPSQFNTKLSFTEHAEKVLLEEGVQKGSKDWNDLVMGARTEYGVDKMERS